MPRHADYKYSILLSAPRHLSNDLQTTILVITPFTFAITLRGAGGQPLGFLGENALRSTHAYFMLSYLGETEDFGS
jgi:hypothetical protein